MPLHRNACADFVPTVGDVLGMTGSHVLMHVGQFVPVRRKLGSRW